MTYTLQQLFKNWKTGCNR